jgi:predicted ATPase/DNA-binding CsgD family transcriptional regulator
VGSDNAFRGVKPVEPAQASASVGGRLPRPASTFVGRAEDVAHLSGLVGARRLVTLVGPSGIGKTRLAVEVAARVAAAYPKGVWLVDLARVTNARDVPSAVISVLGVPPEPGRDPIESIISHLDGEPALLVLDACGHLVEAAASVAAPLLEATAGVTVLATSDGPLGVPGEAVVALGPLPVPESSASLATAASVLGADAVALFRDRAVASTAGAFQLRDEVAAEVASICRSLDGIPLAIELVATRMGDVSPADINARLADRFRRLAGDDGAAPLAHHRLRVALECTYDLLSPSEAALLRRLSAFTGGATLRAVEHVCCDESVPQGGLIDLLTELVSQSLVVADTSGVRARYHLLEAVRAYGRERLVDADELDAVLARHCAWYVSTAELAWQAVTLGDEPSLAAVAADFDNIRAALDWAANGNGRDLGLRLAAAMIPFCANRGLFREGQAWLERALRSSPGASGALRARALWGVGMLAVTVGDVATSVPAAEESLALSRVAGFQRGEAEALNLLGFISVLAQDAFSAMRWSEESVARARSAGDVRWLMDALALHGRAHLLLGHVATARAVFEECRELAGTERHDAVLIGLGWAAMVAGEHQSAEDLFVRALASLQSGGDRFDTALVLSFLGELAWARTDFSAARGFLQDGRALAGVMGTPFPMVRALTGLARLALAERAADKAAELVDQACAEARRYPLPYALARALAVQATVRHASGDNDGAQAALDEAHATSLDNGDDAGAAASLCQLGRLAHARGNDERAAANYTEALWLQMHVGDAAGTASSLEGLAAIALSRGRAIHAARLLGAAGALRSAAGSYRSPEEAPDHETLVAGLRAELDPTALDRALEEGAGLSASDAVALATRGRGARDRPAYGWASLTPREREVAELAAAGLTNSEIGDRLLISSRTVQGTLLRVFSKLSITSRRELRSFGVGA